MTDETPVAIPTAEDLLSQWRAAAKSRGADPAALIEEQASALRCVSRQVVRAITGEERERLHLEAQFKLGQFCAKAAAFQEVNAWAEGLVEVLETVAIALTTGTAKLVAEGLASAMRGGIA